MANLSKTDVFKTGAELGLVIDVKAPSGDGLGTLYGRGRVGGDAVDLTAWCYGEVIEVHALTPDGAAFVELVVSGSL